MNVEELNFIYDPFCDILQMTLEGSPSDLKDSKLSILLDSFDYPIISKKDIPRIKEKLENRSTYKEILDSLNISISYSPTYLQGLTHLPSEEKVEISAKARYILYTYIGWTLMQEKKINFKNISLILGSLNLCLQTPYSTIASNAFLRALAFYANKKSFINVHMLYNSILEFYIKSDTLENEHLMVLQSFLSTLTETLYQTQPKSVLDFFLVIRSIIEAKGTLFNPSVIDGILVTVGPFIKDLLPEALLLLEVIFPLLTLNQKILYVSQTTNTLVDSIKASHKQVKNIAKENSKLFIVSADLNLKPKFEFNNTETFKSGLDFPNDVLTDDPEEIFHFINEPIIENMRNVTNIFIQTKETIIEFQNLIKEKIKGNITLFVFFICTLAEIESKKIKIQNFSDLIFSNEVFNPCILCQQQFKETKDLNVIRNACFRIILDLGEEGILNGIEYFTKTPFMLAEFLCRCINNSSTVIEIIQNSNKIITEIIKIILLYQKYNFDGIYDIEGPRLAILLFLSQIFTDKICEDNFFNNPDFVFAYFSLAFEEPLQPIVIGHIKSYLTKPSAINCPIVGVAISNVTENLKITFPDPKSISLINKLVIAMNEALSHQHQIGDQLVVACASISLSLSMTDTSQFSKEFILNCMTLFAVSSHIFTLDENQKSILEASIIQCFGINPPKLVFEKLMQIISGDDLGFRKPSFYIRQPVALSIIFNVFSESDELLTLIKFLDSLCKNVPANTVECHSGGIDLLILEYLNKRWYDDSLTPEFVDACFGLLRKIAVVSSSVTIIHRFVSLLCPLENKYIPDYFSKVLSTMNNIVASTLNTPRAAIPLDYTNVYEIPDRFPLRDGFTIAFWLKVENPSPRYVPNLLKAMDGDKTILHIYLNNNVIHFYQRSKKVESKAFIDKELDINEWSFLVINYEIVEDSAIINVYNNCLQAPQLKFPVPKSVPLRFIAGGLDEPPAPKTLFTSLGGIVLFNKFNFELINRINQHGPAQLDRESEKPNFVFIPEVDFENKPTSLGYVLATHSKIPSIIPAFSVVNLKYKNGESGGQVADQVVELLSNALLMCEEAENEFSNSRGFAMISHLLLECDPAAITYQVYIRFFSLLQMLRTKELQKQLFLDILVNIRIWIVSDKSSLLRILRHWARVLFPATKHTCASSLQFSDLLNDYVLFMWEEPVDEYAQGTEGTARERRKDVDVKPCSHAFCDCLLIQSHVNINENSMNLLISHIISCKDTLQKTHLIELLRQMALASPTPFERLKEPDAVIPSIHKLMALKSDLANITAINAIVRIHKVCQCQRLLSQDIDILINEIDSESANEILLVLLENEIKCGFPETLPIVFWVAMNLGEERMAATMGHLNTSESFSEGNEWWFFWPLICAAVMPKCADKIMDFVTQCCHRDWKRVLALLCQLTNAFGLSREHLLNSFIVSLSTILCRNGTETNEDDLDSYFEFVWQLLLQIPIDTSALHNSFKNSEFSSEKSLDEKEIEKGFVNNGKFIKGMEYVKFFCESLKVTETKMGFRFDDKGAWIDGDLALIIMNTFSAVKYWKALDLDLYICSRVLFTNPNNAIQHIVLLEIPKDIANEHQIGIDYIYVKMESRGVQCPIEHYKSRSAISNYHHFTEIISQYSTEERFNYENEFVNEIKQFQSDLIKLSNETDNFSISSEFTLSSLATTVSDFQTANESNMTMWNRMWDGLTIDTAPWSKSIPPRSIVMRDTVMCGLFMMPRLIHEAPKILNRQISEFSLATFGNSIKEISVDQEKPLYSTNGHLITPSGDRPVTFNVYKDKISVTAFDGVRREISQNEVDFVMSRKIWHKPTAVEIFRTCGRTMLIHFSEAKPQEIITRINAMHPNSGLGTISVHRELWKKRRISNFEYLMIVNLISGRSNNSIFQYPIFPWVIADYESEVLDLTKRETFRDLTKPIKSNIEKGKVFQKAQLSAHDVCGYLHNLMPYKRLARTFNMNMVESVPKAFKQSLETGTEVVPEMYYMHEFFDDLELPKWANSSIDFVQKMAAALESDYVSENLHAWIDLTFGYLQQTENNLYDQILYEDIWNTADELGLTKNDIIKAKKNLGQIPTKLFRSPHPQRDPIDAFESTDSFVGFPTGVNPIDFSIELTEDPMKVFIRVLGGDGNIFSLNVKMSEQKMFSYTSELNSICGHTSRAYLLSKDSIVRCGGNVVLHNSNFTATIANCSAQCFAKSHKSFIFVSADAMVSMFDIESGTLKKQIPFYSGEATCCDINDVHKMSAIGALRGDVIVHSTTSANFLSVVKLGSATPLFVRIAKKSGHLVVHASEMVGPRTIYSLSALTLNGDLISKKTVRYEFISMICSTTARNLDFVLCATKTGVYAASFPNFELTQVFVGTEAIMSAEYIESMRAIVVLTVQGNVILKRYIPEDTI